MDLKIGDTVILRVRAEVTGTNYVIQGDLGLHHPGVAVLIEGDSLARVVTRADVDAIVERALPPAPKIGSIVHSRTGGTWLILAVDGDKAWGKAQNGNVATLSLHDIY